MTTITDARFIEPGTTTEFGVLSHQTMTGWFTTTGKFVPFGRLENREPIEPLVGGITLGMVKAAALLAPAMEGPVFA